MYFTNVVDIEAFKDVINNKCNGNVWLRSQYGDEYNLKSALTQYIALGALVADHRGELELFADDREDEAELMRFLNENPRVMGREK